MKKLAIAAAVWTGLVLSAMGRADEPKKSDKDRFQGTWLTVSIEQDGQKLSPQELRDLKTTFKDGQYAQSLKGKEAEYGTFELNPDKDPKTIEFKIAAGPDAGKEQPGIYKFDGETLLLCVAKAGEKARPTGFSTKGTTSFVVELRREKP